MEEVSIDDFRDQLDCTSVSYTHLTLPTKASAEISVGAVMFTTLGFGRISFPP